MKRFTDMSIDLETYGTEPGCVILEVGFCFFDRMKPHRPTHQISVFPNIQEQQQMGRTIDMDTLAWWQNIHPEAYVRQQEAVRQSAAECSATLHDVWENLSQRDNTTQVWAKGTHFDIPIYKTLFAEYWGFRNIQDMRTLILACDMVDPLIREEVHLNLPRNEFPHAGLYDAMHQSREIAELCTTLAKVKSPQT